MIRTHGRVHHRDGLVGDAVGVDDGQAPLRLVSGDGRQTGLRRIALRRLDAFRAPVGDAPGANLARLHLCGQRLDDAFHGLRGVVPMQPIEVDHIGLQVAEALLQVVDDVGGLQPALAHIGKRRMRAFGGENDTVAETAVGQPLPDELFAAAFGAGNPVGIDVGRVDERAARVHERIHQTIGVVGRNGRAELGGSQTKGRDVQVGTGNRDGMHGQLLVG